MKQTLCTIISNVQVMPGTYLMWIEAPDIATAAQPGQFITVRCPDLTLRRPFSVHQVSQDKVAILFKIVGKGTLWLSRQRSGDKLDIFGPLGNGFNVQPQSRKLLLTAGGIGIAPLIFLTQRVPSHCVVTLIHGANTAAQIYPDAYQPPAVNHREIRFIAVTEDGSLGQKGLAIDILRDYLDWADQVYACGPVDMYKALADTSLRIPTKSGQGKLKLKKCQISLEVRMGCGLGACYGCTIDTKKGLKRVCRDGPVFELDDIIWQEVHI